MQEFLVDFVMEFHIKKLEANFRAREEILVQKNEPALQLQTQTQGVTQDFYSVLLKKAVWMKDKVVRKVPTMDETKDRLKNKILQELQAFYQYSFSMEIKTDLEVCGTTDKF